MKPLEAVQVLLMLLAWIVTKINKMLLGWVAIKNKSQNIKKKHLGNNPKLNGIKPLRQTTGIFPSNFKILAPSLAHASSNYKTDYMRSIRCLPKITQTKAMISSKRMHPRRRRYCSFLFPCCYLLTPPM